MRRIILVIMMAICLRLLRSVIGIVPEKQTEPGLLLNDQPEMFGWIEVNDEWHWPQWGVLQFVATREGTKDGQSLWRIDHIGQQIEYQGFFCDIHAQLVNIPFNGEILEPANDDYCVMF